MVDLAQVECYEDSFGCLRIFLYLQQLMSKTFGLTAMDNTSNYAHVSSW